MKKQKKKKELKETNKQKEKREESPRKYHFSGLLFGLIIKILYHQGCHEFDPVQLHAKNFLQHEDIVFSLWAWHVT